MEKQPDLDKPFAEAGRRFTSPPPPQAWQRISQRLDARSTRRRNFLLVTLGILGAFGLGVWLGRTSAPDPVMPVAAEVLPEVVIPVLPEPRGVQPPENLTATEQPVTRQGAVGQVVQAPPEDPNATGYETFPVLHPLFIPYPELAYGDYPPQYHRPEPVFLSQTPLILSPPAKQAQRLAVGIFAAPAFGFQTARASGSLEQENLDKEVINTSGGGIFLQIPAGGRWDYRVGVHYSQWEKRIDNPWVSPGTPGSSSTMNGNADVTSSAGAVPLEGITSFQVNEFQSSGNQTYFQLNASLVQQVGYLDFPLGLGYRFVQSRWLIQGWLGLSPRLAVSRQVFLTNSQGARVDGKAEVSEKLGLLGWGGLSLGYRITPHWWVEVQPQAAYGLLSQVDQRQVNSREQQLALLLALGYRF